MITFVTIASLTQNIFLCCRVGNALFFLSLVVGGITRSFGLIFATMTNWFDEVEDSDKVVAFLVGFIVGLVICSIVLSPVASGVNAVIVLFADAPAELQQTYPEISRKMRSSWAELYPQLVYTFAMVDILSLQVKQGNS